MSVYPVYDPETEGFVYQVVHSPHTESISDIISETESTTSATTISSDQVLDYFVTLHGRQHPASENALRWLPAGDTRRDILGHVVMKYTYGQNYLGPVKKLLDTSPERGSQHQVLEIGTRSGGWVQEMAAEFPHVQFRSLDIVPLVPHTPRANIHFEVYDISEGLMLESSSQDIVFVNMGLLMVDIFVQIDLATLITAGYQVKNYQALLCEIYRVLRPGGLIHLRELCLGFWDPADHSRLARITNPIGCHFVDLIQAGMKRTGADPHVAIKLHQWLAPESEIWGDSGKTTGFERICTNIRTPCAFLHEGYPCADNVDPHMVPVISYVYAASVRDSISLLCEGGISREEAGLLAEATVIEMMDPDKCALAKVYTVYATKSQNGAF